MMIGNLPGHENPFQPVTFEQGIQPACAGDHGRFWQRVAMFGHIKHYITFWMDVKRLGWGGAGS